MGKRYDWLNERVSALRALNDEYELGWSTSFNKPASLEAIEEAESVIGLPLPPSLRAFYALHDGGEVADYSIRPVAELAEQTVGARSFYRDLQDGGDDLLLPLIDEEHGGNVFVLDASSQSADTEYPVLEIDESEPPSIWRENGPIASSFEVWLRDIFVQVLDEGFQPDYHGRARLPLSEASFNADRYHRLASEALATAEREQAIHYACKALSLRGNRNFGCMTEDANLIRQLAKNDPRIEFFCWLFDRAAATRLAAEVSEDRSALRFTERYFLSDSVQQIEERVGVRFGDIRFLVERFWDIYLMPTDSFCGVHLTLHNIRRLESNSPRLASLPPDSLIIGVLPGAGQLVLELPSSRVRLAPYGGDLDLQQGADVWEDLRSFFDAALAARLAGNAPFHKREDPWLKHAGKDFGVTELDFKAYQ